jgi:hypothetical protein
MRLTDKHIKNGELNRIIEQFNYPDQSAFIPQPLVELCLNALLELKQRRAEDRYMEHKHGTSNNA